MKAHARNGWELRVERIRFIEAHPGLKTRVVAQMMRQAGLYAQTTGMRWIMRAVRRVRRIVVGKPLRATGKRPGRRWVLQRKCGKRGLGSLAVPTRKEMNKANGATGRRGGRGWRDVLQGKLQALDEVFDREESFV